MSILKDIPADLFDLYEGKHTNFKLHVSHPAYIRTLLTWSNNIWNTSKVGTYFFQTIQITFSTEE